MALVATDFQEEDRSGHPSFSDPLSRARALERRGLSREACDGLIRALAKEPERVDWMQTLAWWLYRDGREGELLTLLRQGPKVYGDDAYLVLQKASCLFRLQHFGEARKEYRRVLALTRNPEWRRQAKDDLRRLKEEEAIFHTVREGLNRARVGILAGALLLGGGGAFLWLASRREHIAHGGSSRD